MVSWYIDRKGYRRFSDSGESVHCWVAEDKVGGELWKGAVVHHKDRDKLNNDPDNFWVFRSLGSTTGRTGGIRGGMGSGEGIFI